MPAVVEKTPEYQIATKPLSEPTYGGFLENLEKANHQKIRANHKEWLLLTRQQASHAIKEIGENPKSLTELADLHLERGRTARAIAYYKKALSLDPYSVYIYEKLIDTLINVGELNEANEVLLTLIDKSSKQEKFVTNFLNFRLAFFSSSEEEAIKTSAYFDEFAPLASKSTGLLLTRSLFELIVKNDLKNAKGLLTRLLLIDKSNIHANNNLGVFYKMELDFKNAEKYLHKANFLDLKYIPAYENLAATYLQQNNFTKAIQTLETARVNRVQMGVDWDSRLSWLYFKTGQVQKSLAENRTLLKKNPGDISILNNLAVCYLNLNETDEASKILKEATSIIGTKKSREGNLPESAVFVFYNYVKIQIKLGYVDRAIRYAQKAQKLFPSHYLAFYQEGLIRIYEQRDHEKANACFEKALNLNPRSTETAVNYSYTLADYSFDFQKAIDVLTPFAKIENQEAKALVFNNLAYSYIKLGKLKEAKKFLLEEDKSFASYATKGLYHLIRGDRKTSEEMYKKSLNQAPHDSIELVKQFYHFEQAIYWSKIDKQKATENCKAGLKVNVNPQLHAKLANLLKEIS